MASETISVMARVVEFQTATDPAAGGWETQCRFVLVDGRVETVHVDEPATRAEVEDLVSEISEISGTTPDDGADFMVALGDYDDGSRFARMTSPRIVDIAAARTTEGLVPVEDDEEGSRPEMELIGRLVRDALAPH